MSAANETLLREFEAAALARVTEQRDGLIVMLSLAEAKRALAEAELAKLTKATKCACGCGEALRTPERKRFNRSHHGHIRPGGAR